jgi:hypothetical protein
MQASITKARPRKLFKLVRGKVTGVAQNLKPPMAFSSKAFAKTTDTAK